MDSLIFLLLLGLVYFLPTIVASYRHVPSEGSVAVINIFLGWTLLGWVVALAMACRTVPAAHLAELEARRATQQSAKPPRGELTHGRWGFESPPPEAQKQGRKKGYGWWKDN